MTKYHKLAKLEAELIETQNKIAEVGSDVFKVKVVWNNEISLERLETLVMLKRHRRLLRLEIKSLQDSM